MVVLQPPVTTNYMVRPGKDPELVEVISELGIFGYVIGWVTDFLIAFDNSFASAITIINVILVVMPDVV